MPFRMVVSYQSLGPTYQYRIQGSSSHHPFSVLSNPAVSAYYKQILPPIYISSQILSIQQ
jgi:hypothetical protein